MSQTPRQWFASTLASGEMIVAPGAYDGLMARLVARAGFRAAYMTGAGTAASHGLPSPAAVQSSTRSAAINP